MSIDTKTVIEEIRNNESRFFSDFIDRKTDLFPDLRKSEVIVLLPEYMYLYTFNFSRNSVEKSYMKLRKISDNDYDTLINFDIEKPNSSNYIGQLFICNHAIFINTVSIKYIDNANIILINDYTNYKQDYYDYGFVSVGVLNSYGRRSTFPEAKKIIVSERELSERMVNKIGRILQSNGINETDHKEILEILEKQD